MLFQESKYSLYALSCQKIAPLDKTFAQSFFISRLNSTNEWDLLIITLLVTCLNSYLRL